MRDLRVRREVVMFIVCHTLQCEFLYTSVHYQLGSRMDILVWNSL